MLCSPLREQVVPKECHHKLMVMWQAMASQRAELCVEISLSHVHSLMSNGGTAICALSRTRLGTLRTHARLAHKTVIVMVSLVPPETSPESPLQREEPSWCIVASDWTEEQSSSPAAWVHSIREESAHNLIIVAPKWTGEQSCPLA
jgi:hypothetical protein